MKIWEPTDGKNIVILEAVVEDTGAVADITTNKSRAGDVAIQAATVAFEKVQPLEPMPATQKGRDKLTITFSSTVDPHGDSTSNIFIRIEPLAAAPLSQEHAAQSQDAVKPPPVTQ